MSRLLLLSDLAAATHKACGTDIEAAANVLVETLRRGGKVLVCGNGGSAAQASHFAAELTGRYRDERRPLPAIALTDPAALTCIANDFGYSEVFARQVEAFGSASALVCLSTSGKSRNVKRAALRGRELGVADVWITGAVDIEPYGPRTTHVRIPSTDTALVQEVTLSVLHTLCERIEGEAC